jgi:hypothetical protein
MRLALTLLTLSAASLHAVEAKKKITLVHKDQVDDEITSSDMVTLSWFMKGNTGYWTGYQIAFYDDMSRKISPKCMN